MKKLLALVLALVMSMSLVTISNADFKDADKISNKEAVDVMAAVGVLAGYTDGSFGATDTLTRAQACKIIAYLDLGGKTADAIKGSGTVFSDVAATAWYAGYVEYCAGAGYVAGIGDNKFAPDEKVTGVQFAKMLLCALGYKAEIEGYTGADYTIAIARDANKADLFDALSITTSAALTREQAAQMAFNALKATVVEYSGGTNITTSDGTKITMGATRSEVADNGDSYTATNDGKMQLCEKLYGDKLELTDAGETDAYGRPAVTWEYNNKDVGTYATAAKKVYTGKLTAGTLLKDFNLDDGDSVDVWAVVDGQTTLQKVTGDYEIEDKYDDTVLGAVGSVTEVFTDDDGNISKIVNIPYLFGEVTDVTEADEDDADSKRTITIASKEFETESFDEDDIVVYTLGLDEGEVVIVTVAEPEAVSGKVTAVKGSGYTVSGTKYTKMDTVGGDGAPSVGDEGTIYLNVDGSFGWFSEKSSSTGNFIYIYNVTTNDSDADEDGRTGSTYTAYYVGADGVKAKAELAKDDDGKVLGGQAADSADARTALRGMYEYELTDDGLEAISNGNIAGTTSKLANVKIARSAYADSKTVFVFVYNKNADAGTDLDVASEKIVSKVVTGIKNVEEFRDLETVKYVTKDGMVTYAFVLAAPADAESDATYGILLSTTAEETQSDDGKTKYYTYEVMLDGKKDTLTAKNSSTKFNGIDKGDAFSYTLVDGYLSNVVKVTGDVTGEVDKVVGNDVVVAGDVYTLADDVTVYVVKELANGDLKVTLGSIKADDAIYAVKNDDDELKFVVVDNR